MNSPPEDRSSLATALAWASRIITISLGMVVPGLIGYLVDRQLNTKALFTLAGFVVGVALGMWQLIRATRAP